MTIVHDVQLKSNSSSGLNRLYHAQDFLFRMSQTERALGLDGWGELPEA